jgi:hypothetical protein
VICKCGHLQVEHRFRGFFGAGSVCEVAIPITKDIGYICRCPGFIGDNLRYLEQQYEKGIKL